MISQPLNWLGMTVNTMPGWYPDPTTAGLQRWWDGHSWTNAAAPMVVAPHPASPQDDLAAELKAGRRASAALIFGAALLSINCFAGAFLYHYLGPFYGQIISQATEQNSTSQPPELPVGLRMVSGASNLTSLGSLAVGILFLVWFYKAATLANRAGLPARRSPGWAIGGFLIPVVNFWFPYQSAVDMFPTGHPGRQRVKLWWGLWLAASFAVLVVGVTSIFSIWIGVALAVVATFTAIGAALAGRALITELARTHKLLIDGQHGSGLGLGLADGVGASDSTV